MSFLRMMLVLAAVALAVPSPVQGGKLIRFHSRIVHRPAGEVDVETGPDGSRRAVAAPAHRGVQRVSGLNRVPRRTAGLRQSVYQPNDDAVAPPQPLPESAPQELPQFQSAPGSSNEQWPAPVWNDGSPQPASPPHGAWYPLHQQHAYPSPDECDCAEQKKLGRLQRLRQHLYRKTLWWRLKHQETCQCVHGDSYYDPIEPQLQPAYGHHQTTWRQFPEYCLPYPPQLINEPVIMDSIPHDLPAVEPPLLPPLPSVLTIPQPIPRPISRLPIPPLPDLPLPQSPAPDAPAPVQLAIGTASDAKSDAAEIAGAEFIDDAKQPFILDLTPADDADTRPDEAAVDSPLPADAPPGDFSDENAENLDSMPAENTGENAADNTNTPEGAPVQSGDHAEDATELDGIKDDDQPAQPPETAHAGEVGEESGNPK